MGQSPSWLLCPVERRMRYWDRDAHRYVNRGRFAGEHRLVRTGRSKPRPHGGAPGHRSLLTKWEIRCACGHVGWTTHIDALDLPFAADADLSWRHIDTAPREGPILVRDGAGEPLRLDRGYHGQEHHHDLSDYTEWKPTL